MNNKTLIILINDYPFNIGEPFFEHEIEVLSKEFKQIFLFSVMGKKNENPTRVPPANVSVTPLSCNHNRIKYVLKGIFRKKAIKNNNVKKSLKMRLMDDYFFGRSNQIAKKIIKKMSGIKTENEIVVYTYWLTLGLAALLIKPHIVSQGKQVSIISRGHGYDIYSEMMPCNYHPYQDYIVDNLDHICPCSNYGVAYLQAKYSKSKNKFSINRLGTIDNGKAEYNHDDNKEIFATCSGLRTVKRLDLFAEAFCDAAKTDDSIYWYIIGDGPYRKVISNIVRKNNLTDKVVFFGNINNSLVYDFYKKNNIFFFVNVSASEGVPVSIMEAISFGTPVIATNVGGNSEIVNDDNGFLIDKDFEIKNLSNLLLDVIKLPNKMYSSLREASRLKWCQMYDADKNLCDWLKILNGDYNE